MNKILRKQSHQRGAATIFIALVVTLLILIMSISGFKIVTVEARMTSNYIEQEKLFVSSESALRDAESRVINSSLPMGSCNPTDPITANTMVMKPEAACYNDRIPDLAVDDFDATYGMSFEIAGSGIKKGYHAGVNSLNVVTASFIRGGYFYYRYITTDCPKGNSGTSALDAAITSCTEYYEVNSIGYDINDPDVSFSSGSSNWCNANTVCLRSTVNRFNK